MNLKNIFVKITATFAVIAMMAGNFSLLGTGLSAVIAEEINKPVLNAEVKLSKYVQYDTNGEKGVIVKYKLSEGDNQTNENYKPVQSKTINVQASKINDKMPERVKVIANSTKAINGKEGTEVEFNENNWNYDKDSGLLTISLENNSNYSTYLENAKDEFEIIYIYGSDSYLGNANEINLSLNVKVSENVKEDKTTVQIEKNVESNVNVKDNIGDIVSLDSITSTEIYKGYMYSNNKNKTSYETEYNTISNLDISNSSLIDNIFANLNSDNFVTATKKGNTLISTNENIYYKSTTMSKKEFDTILGIDGYIEINNNNENIATIKYGEPDNKQNRKLQIVYANGETKEVENNDITVEYTKQFSNISIKTSKPLTEGTLQISNRKSIKAFSQAGVENIKAIQENLQISSNKTITEEQEKKDENRNAIYDENGNIQKEQITKQVDINNYSSKRLIELKEPETKVDLSIDNTKLSTLTENNINLTATLRTDNAKYKLFKNPVIKIELPDGIESVTSTGIKLLYGQNTLKIKNATIQNNKNILIEIDGTQAQYNINAIQEGASVIIPLSIKFNKLTPTQDSKINVTVDNNGEKTSLSKDIRVASKEGLMSITNLYGYNGNKELTLIDNQKEEAILEVGKELQTATMKSTLVNNYQKNLKNIIVLGKISETEEIASKLKGKIKVNKKATIYYSENKDANPTDDSWVQEVKDYSNVKSYMIIIDSLGMGENVAFEYNFTIPEKLEYNKKTAVKYNVYSEFEGKDSKTTSRQKVLNQLPEPQNKVEITLKTENVPNVSVEVKPNISLNYVHEGQIVEYIVKVKNEGKQTANNVIIEDVIPENATYAEYTSEQFVNHSQGGFRPIENIKTKELKIDELPAGQSKEISIFLKVNNTTQDTEILENKINVNVRLETTNELKTIATATNKLEIKKAVLDVEIKYESTNNKLEEGAELNYYIYIENISDNDVKNVKVTNQLDKDLVFERAMSLDRETIDFKINEDNILTFNLGEIKAKDIERIKISTTLGNNTNYTSKILKSRAQVSAKSIEDYETNNILYNVKGSKVSVELKSPTNTNVKERESITYNLTLKNEGEATKNIKLKDTFPEEFAIDTVETTIEGKTEKQTSVGNEFVLLDKIKPNTTLQVKIIGNMSSIGDNKELELKNMVYVDILNDNHAVIKTIKTDTITNIIEKSDKINSSDNTGEVNPDPDNNKDNDSNSTDTGSDNNNNNNNTNNNGSNNGTTNEDNRKHSIRGVAWLDSNKNGQKDSEETVLPNISIKVINADTNQFVKNSNGEIYNVTTANNGAYIVEGLSKGNYILVFEYDTNTYTVTSYKKDGVESTVNSDVINKNITVDGNTKLVALTDTLSIDETGISNINIGLIENATFDLSINKYIDKVEVINSKGTETHTWENKDTAKVDLVAKYINTAKIVVDYKFVITNNGDVTGYVDKLVDNLPSGLEFSSELNTNWYKESDGKISTTSLSGIKIEPGQTSEIHLLLTKNMTENNTGIIPNTVTLEKISNLEQISEKDSATQNNESSATLVLSIKTGSPILYISITIGCIAVIALGAYLIKKKVLKGNE